MGGGEGETVVSVSEAPAALSWRGFALAPSDEEDAFVFEGVDLYLGVAREESGKWSAIIECGQLESEGEGPTPEAALEFALTELWCVWMEHRKLISDLEKAR